MAQFNKDKALEKMKTKIELEKTSKNNGKSFEEKLFERYFIADSNIMNDPNINEVYTKEFNKAVESMNGNNLNYPHVYDLSPKTQSALLSMLAVNILSKSSLLGYRLNTHAILSDLEDFLVENPTETILASVSDPNAPITEYLKGLVKFFRDDLLESPIMNYVKTHSRVVD